MPVKGRNNRTYADLSQALRRHAQLHNVPCWLCGKPIDWDADWRSGDSYTYDHVETIAQGGHMRGQGRPAHRSCNSRRKAGTANVTTPTTTRKW